MHINNRNVSRVLAAALASGGFGVAPMPTNADTLSCTAGSFTASPDGQGNIIVNCARPGGTPVCTLAASPTSLPASGGTVTLTANNCGTISSWTKAGTIIPQQTSVSWQDQIGANTGTASVSYTYTVNGGTSASVTVMEAAPSTSPPPPGALSCAGYSNTLVYDLPWNAQSKIVTKGFNNDSMVVARFTTPATSVVSNTANIASAQYTEPTVVRTGALSTVPCDLTGQGTGAVSSGVSLVPNWTYQINGSNVYRLSILTVVALKPSTTYYFNLTNRDRYGSRTCTAASCEMIVQLTLPSGL